MEDKQDMRRRAYDARKAQENKDEVSQKAIEHLVALPEYQQAKTVMWYIDARTELRTRQYLPEALASDKTIVVPYCTSDENGENKLGLYVLEDMDELVVGKWQILEPPKERWGETGKEVAPEDLDFVIVPGVGFDRTGGRMGNGQGYYDRLLERVRPDAPLVAICYEAQIFDKIPVDDHDVYMDKIVTEEGVFNGKGRG
ncbi:5-formyltetrahydrofolate cyclo-ligase [Thiohalorhabdus methylotrophus]|uniref:5-formyltetrahydrofolate cyclo-ligase n=1 Tax=Thiohalorhabdus methylotrophus TaxID=3242694 RepID=A0ABV4U0R3_9GAMM